MTFTNSFSSTTSCVKWIWKLLHCLYLRNVLNRQVNGEELREYMQCPLIGRIFIEGLKKILKAKWDGVDVVATVWLIGKWPDPEWPGNKSRLCALPGPCAYVWRRSNTVRKVQTSVSCTGNLIYHVSKSDVFPTYKTSVRYRKGTRRNAGLCGSVLREDRFLLGGWCLHVSLMEQKPVDL